MAGSWDIKLPPPLVPLNPVRPGTAIRDRKDPRRQPHRDPERQQEPELPGDDQPPHIDDYA